MFNTGIDISQSQMQRIAHDSVKCAEAANLLYVNDSDPGIKRVRKGRGFVYYSDGKKITDKKTLDRIKKIVIPPAWKNVWICNSEAGHIQATGLDMRNRKQYKYHTLWNELRNQTKFSRLLSFGEKLPLLRLQIESHLAKKTLCFEKVIAALIAVMERTYIRIGNSGYEKIYGSYGLTTLKDKHVTFRGDTALFLFKGKKGITQKISLNNRKLARIVKQCREIPGKELFQYYDEEGKKHSIDSGMVNRYIKDITGEDFTAKDFRTWAGTLNALRAFQLLGEAENTTALKKKIVEALNFVSEKLGNTRTVCKKYYVHPVIINLYESQSLSAYLRQLDTIEKNDDLTGWAKDEIILMKILKEQTR